MKKVLFFIAVVFISTIIVAQESNNVDFDKSVKKNTEKVTLTKKNGKVVAEYNSLGSLTKKTFYLWSNYHSSWVPSQKYEYAQDLSSSKMTVTFTKWNNSAEAWENRSDVFTYEMNNEGMLSLKQPE